LAGKPPPEAMLIVCPNCATSYMIDPVSLGPAGRMVRCARCKQAWHVGGSDKPPSDVNSFVNDVIAEADAQQSGQPTQSKAPAERPGVPPLAPPAQDNPQQDNPQQSTPDDFGAEPAATVGVNQDLPHDSPFTQDRHDPVPDIAAPEAPSIVPPQGHPPLRDASTTRIDHIDHEDMESFAIRRERMHVKVKKTRRSSKWTAIVLVLLGFNIALVGARHEVVRFVPQTASLFAAIGLPVNLRKMTFENVKVTKEDADGVPVLLVEGEIVSASRMPVEVPRIRFAVRNMTGQEIYAWTALATRSALNPGERLPFRSRLASPPPDASDVMVRFFNSRDASFGSK
jgi:predicted Zn finger-like uncharacterized protein